MSKKTYLFSFQRGLPVVESCLQSAWNKEPLTHGLKKCNISLILPATIPENSIVALLDDEVIGQCSLNRAIDYWTHLEKINLDGQNFSSCVFAAIHQKAVRVEKQYLDQIGESQEKAFHNAGVAVLPEYWGHRLGLQMMKRQIQLCKELKCTALFCETTNRYSAAIVEELGFTRIANYPYKMLAKELRCPDLLELDDSFIVWCLNFSNLAFIS